MSKSEVDENVLLLFLTWTTKLQDLDERKENTKGRLLGTQGSKLSPFWNIELKLEPGLQETSILP